MVARVGRAYLLVVRASREQMSRAKRLPLRALGHVGELFVARGNGTVARCADCERSARLDDGTDAYVNTYVYTNRHTRTLVYVHGFMNMLRSLSLSLSL